MSRLALTTLETWKRKARAADEALELLKGCADSELAIKVYRILERAARPPSPGSN